METVLGLDEMAKAMGLLRALGVGNFGLIGTAAILLVIIAVVMTRVSRFGSTSCSTISLPRTSASILAL